MDEPRSDANHLLKSKRQTSSFSLKTSFFAQHPLQMAEIEGLTELPFVFDGILES